MAACRRAGASISPWRQRQSSRRRAPSATVTSNSPECSAHDWHAGAVARLRALCDDHDARIVVSSDWRQRRSVAQLQALFRIHDLHHLVVDRTCDHLGAPHYRAGEVKQYLDTHRKIERFVIIDDGYRSEFDQLFPDHFVHTGSFLDESDALRARQILSGGPVTQENRRLQPMVFQGDYRSLFG